MQLYLSVYLYDFWNMMSCYSTVYLSVYLYDFRNICPFIQDNAVVIVVTSIYLHVLAAVKILC
jgi:hypothetical protein